MSADPLFRVVVNARDQLALWPLGRPPPAGWHRTAMAGSRDRCCHYIDRLPPPPAVARIRAAYVPPGPPPGPGPSLLFDRLGEWPASAPAVADAHTRIGFGELRRRVAAVRADLDRAGITDGERVLVRLPVGVDLVVALLGVLAAGGVAVPVATDATARARTAVAADSQASFLLVGGAARRVRPAPVHRPPDAALVLYPYGAGPLGVVWEHPQIAGLAEAAEATVGGPFDRMVLPPTLGRPLFSAGLVWALGTGAEAVLDDETDRRTGTVSLTEAPARSSRAGRETDADPEMHADAETGRYRAVLRRGPRPPTGLTGFTAAVGPVLATPDPTRPAPARPLSGVRLLVLDHDLMVTAPGVTGRLCLAGRPVGGGYLGRPGLTARVFLPDPTGPPGSRMLDTGRTARRTAAGEVTL